MPRRPPRQRGGGHDLARIVYQLLRFGLAYVKQTEAAYAEQMRARQEWQLQRRARELGYELTKVEAVSLTLVE